MIDGAWEPGDSLLPAERPTMYFVGVTTHQSSIQRIFPKWIELLDVDVKQQGVNFPVRDKPENFRRFVEFLKCDPLSLGALITTHKLDVVAAAKDLIDAFDEFGKITDEASCLSKRDGKLIGHAKDMETCGRALDAIIPDNYWATTNAEALILGAGGSSVAMTWHLLQKSHGSNRPSRIVVTNRSIPRLQSLQQLHEKIGADLPIEYHHTPTAQQSDALFANLKPGSIVMNATGLGKDAPGSPITNNAVWPERGIAWDFNYRGNLVFLDQARAQVSNRNLQIEDGWVYFLHGWTSVMAEILDIDIPISGPMFDKLSKVAAVVR